MTNSNSEEQSSFLDDLAGEIGRVLEVNLSTPVLREEHGPFVLQVLQKLNDQVHTVIEEANGYPENSVSAHVWMNGVKCGEFASALTQHFRESGWLVHEQHASSMWVHAILAVCSHYYHMVGPAMLANADCHDRQGNGEQATKMYISVVKDFANQMVECLESSDALTEEETLSLESFAIAIQRLLDRGIDEADDMDIAMLLADTNTVLARPGRNAR